MSSNCLILQMRKTKFGILESLCSAGSHFLTAATTVISIYWVPCTVLAFSYQLAHLWDSRELGIKSRLHGGKNWGSEKWQNWFTNPDLSFTQEPVPFPLCLAAYRSDKDNPFTCKKPPGTMGRYSWVMGRRPHYRETPEGHNVEKGNCMRTTPSTCLDTLSISETGHGSLCYSDQLCSSARSWLLIWEWRGRMNERGQAVTKSPTWPSLDCFLAAVSSCLSHCCYDSYGPLMVPVSTSHSQREGRNLPSE